MEDYYNKYHDVLKRVTTPYVIQADNDDFFILNNIPELIKSLEVNVDVVGVRGEHTDFIVYGSSFGINNNIQGSRYTAIARSAPSLEMESSIERIDYLCKNMARFDYYSNWYCIFRTEIVLEIWNRLMTISIKEPLLIEILMHVYLLEKGKILIFNFPYYLRQQETSQFGDTLVINNNFVERCVFHGVLSEFGISINKFLTSHTEHEKKEVLKSITIWFQQFIVNIHNNSMRYHNSQFYKFRKRLKSIAYVGPFSEIVYLYISNLFKQQGKRKFIKIKEIENYIIK